MKSVFFVLFLFISIQCFSQSPATRWDIQKDSLGVYTVYSISQATFKTSQEAQAYILYMIELRQSEVTLKQSESVDLNRISKLLINEKPKEQPDKKKE